ncbi:MAG: hypothetical protein NWF04_07525 [Candidatus Bathyarchaeota archaeon]|nr:hypothetical protein [Candidatus Bathyarchaeota archaeon]
MFVTDILAVLYKPHKAFKKIVENPRYFGPIVIVILFVALQTSFWNTHYSKQNFEVTYPTGTQLGSWTQNTTLWTTVPAAASVNSNLADFINATNYGNSSLQIALSDSSSLAATLDFNGTANCSSDGFPNMSMRIKQASPQASPNSVMLYLYSDNSSADYFAQDITSYFTSIDTEVWNNLTLAVGPDVQGWSTTGNAQWGSLTDLKLEFTYPTSSDITLRFDAMFFRGLSDTVISASGTDFYIFFVQNALLQILIQWLLTSALFYFLIKAFKGVTTWKPLMIAIGFALIVVCIQAAITTVAATTLPDVYFPIEAQALVPGEDQPAGVMAYQSALEGFLTLYYVIQIAALAWLAGLGTIIVHALTELTWRNCALVSVLAYTISFFVLPYIYLLLNIIAI